MSGSRFDGCDETVTLPGTLHVLYAHRDNGHVTLEAWSPSVIQGVSAVCYLDVADRRALAAFLLRDLT